MKRSERVGKRFLDMQWKATLEDGVGAVARQLGTNHPN